MTATVDDRVDVDAQTACYVYCVVPAKTELDADITGMDGAPVDLLVDGELAAVVQPVDPGRTFGRRADLLSHSRVVDAVVATTTAVPIRFGSVAESRDAVAEDLLRSRGGDFAELLEWLGGSRQLTLQVRYRQDVVLAEVVAADPEIARLREATRDRPEDEAVADRVRLGQLVADALEGLREQDSAAILDRLAPLAREHRVRDGGGLDHLLDLAVLVDDDRRDEFEAAAEELAAEYSSRATFRLLGPLAPYDFVPEE